MAADFSFDVVSEVDLNIVSESVQVAMKEIVQPLRLQGFGGLPGPQRQGEDHHGQGRGRVQDQPGFGHPLFPDGQAGLALEEPGEGQGRDRPGRRPPAWSSRSWPASPPTRPRRSAPPSRKRRSRSTRRSRANRCGSPASPRTSFRARWRCCGRAASAWKLQFKNFR